MHEVLVWRSGSAFVSINQVNLRRAIGVDLARILGAHGERRRWVGALWDVV